MKLAVLRNYKNVGKLHGDGDAFASGEVAHVKFDNVKQLGKILTSVAQKPRLCVCIGNFPKDGEVVPQDKVKDVSQMSRTKTTVNHGNILVIDNDSGETFDIDIFAKYWDAFEGAGYIETRSGSTLLGKKKNGTHTYFIVRGNTVQLSKAFELLEAICIIEGYSKVEFYKTGKAVIKTPIDMSLSQPSRLVYEDDVEPEIVDGDNISIVRFPDNYKDIMQQAESIKNDVLNKQKDEEIKLHKAYMLEHSRTKFETNEQAEDSLRKFDTYEIDENFPLHINGKHVGDVRDLLLGHLDEVLFSDLYEPQYDNGSQKARYYPDTRTFFSQAHGGIKYTIVVSDEFNNEMLNDFLKEMPHLADVANMSDEMSEIMLTTNDIERGRLIKAHADLNGVTPTIVNREIKRLKPLMTEFDKFYELWVRGEYDATINPYNRLKNYHKYVKESHYVNNGSKNIVIRHHKNDNGGTSITMNPVSVESEFYADRKTTLMNFDEDSKITTFKEVDTVDLFVNGSTEDSSGVIPPARRYTGVEFAPNRKLNVAYNLFQGFDVKPVKGDISKWEAVMSASFGKEHYNFIMDWFADMYQNPNRKVMFAVVVKGEKGCVPCDTEFLTPTGWKRIDEYVDGDMVCEWSPDGSTTFKRPKDYVKLPAYNFTNVKSMTVDMTLSQGHRVPYITSKGNHGVKPFHEIQRMSNYTIPRFFQTPDNATGINMSDDEIRLLIMQTADGTIAKNKIRVSVKKERKKLRAVEILENLNIEYLRVDDANTGFSRFIFKPIQLKKDLSELWSANKAQMKLIYDEMLAWDGSIFKRDGRDVCCFSGNKHDNDLFQYVATCVTNRYVNIFKDNREYKKESIYEAKVSTRNTNNVSKSDKLTTVNSEDGFQYCFETSSSFWLMRQNGRIYPTGNTGKNTFEEVLGRSLLPDQYYMRTANKDQLFGKFNKQLASNLLTVGQEIVWGGDHNHDSVLKDMITERSRTIEIKGQDSFNVANFSRMYITSNADWVIPATKDERRFYVASTTGKVTKARWKRFWRWLERDEVKEALMYEMMHRDLSKFSNIVCPETEELLEQQRETLYGVEKFITEGMEDGFFGSNENDIGSIKCEAGAMINTSDLYEQFKHAEPRSKMSRDKFSKTLKKMGFISTRNKHGRGIIVPSKLAK